MPATASLWTCDAASAHALLPGFSAAIDPTRPARGLHDVALNGQNCTGLSILGVMTDSLSGEAQTPVEWHARGSDQVASYESTQGPAVRLDLVWSVAENTSDDHLFARVNLLVSARTNVLDWHPDVVLCSELPGGAVFSVGEQSDACLEPNESCIADGELLTCVWYRPAAAAWSYVEMVHPADVRHGRWSMTAGSDRRQLRRHLYRPESLERGVILRARARGLFLPAEIDAAVVAKYYADFVSADPQLSTR